MEKGLKAERLTIELLRRNGTDARWSTDEEDMFFKVDIWFPIGRGWIGIQLSIDKKDIMGDKGKKVLRLGIVPMWIDWNKLQTAIEENDGVGLAKEFCTRVKKILVAFPKIKKFSKSEWNLTLQIK